MARKPFANKSIVEMRDLTSARQDVNYRAAQITAIDLGLNGLHAWVVWQNTVTLPCNRVCRIGMHI